LTRSCVSTNHSSKCECGTRVCACLCVCMRVCACDMSSYVWRRVDTCVCIYVLVCACVCVIGGEERRQHWVWGAGHVERRGCVAAPRGAANLPWQLDEAAGRGAPPTRVPTGARRFPFFCRSRRHAPELAPLPLGAPSALPRPNDSRPNTCARTHTQARTHTRARTRARTHAHTRVRTHVHTHTHTRIHTH
jgi:hypothetical protein